MSDSLKIRFYFDNSCGWISNSCWDISQHLLFSFYQFVPSGLHSTGPKSRQNKITGLSKANSHYFWKHQVFFSVVRIRNYVVYHPKDNTEAFQITLFNTLFPTMLTSLKYVFNVYLYWHHFGSETLNRIKNSKLLVLLITTIHLNQ